MEGDSTSQLTKRSIVAAILLCLVALVQVWVVSAGTFISWPTHTALYAQQADGFLHGHTYLPLPPSPQLLALPNPYDPRANHPYALHDVVLFDGKYYLPWGPVPALIAAAGCAAIRADHPNFGDQYLTFAFLLGTVAACACLVWQIARKSLAKFTLAPIVVTILSLGLGTPVLFTLARAAVYEQSIVAAQFFLVCGLCAAWQAFSASSKPALWAALAGSSWALAAGSRIALIPAIIALTLLTLYCLHRNRSRLAVLCALSAPMLAAAILLGAYNFARFHSPGEFGLRYQLAGRDQLHSPASDLASPRTILASGAMA